MWQPWQPHSGASTGEDRVAIAPRNTVGQAYMRIVFKKLVHPKEGQFSVPFVGNEFHLELKAPTSIGSGASMPLLAVRCHGKLP